MVYTLVGPSYLVSAKIEEVILENHFEKEEKFFYDLEEFSLFTILECINTISFLSPKKVVLIKNAFFLGGETKRKIEEEEIEAFIEYLNHPFEDVLVILEIEKMDERKKKLIQTIKEKTNVLFLEENSAAQIKTALKGYTLEKGALELLVEAFKNEEARISLECDKLKLYRMDTKEITKEDVRELIHFALPDQEQISFAFSRSLAEKDKKAAYKNYQLLQQMGIDGSSLMGLLENQFRTLYQVKVLMNQGYTKDKIAAQLAYHPFRVQKTQELARFFSKESICSYLLLLQQFDFAIKSGMMDSSLFVDLLIMRI